MAHIFALTGQNPLRLLNVTICQTADLETLPLMPASMPSSQLQTTRLFNLVSKRLSSDQPSFIENIC
jgi:hypothetical protein